jgi:hypothetical protein
MLTSLAIKREPTVSKCALWLFYAVLLTFSFDSNISRSYFLELFLGSVCHLKEMEERRLFLNLLPTPDTAKAVLPVSNSLEGEN